MEQIFPRAYPPKKKELAISQSQVIWYVENPDNTYLVQEVQWSRNDAICTVGILTIARGTFDGPTVYTANVGTGVVSRKRMAPYVYISNGEPIWINTNFDCSIQITHCSVQGKSGVTQFHFENGVLGKQCVWFEIGGPCYETPIFYKRR